MDTADLTFAGRGDLERPSGRDVHSALSQPPQEALTLPR
jgi:hypothetical protein